MDEVVVSGTDGLTDSRTWEGSVKVGFLTSVSAVIIPKNRKPAQDCFCLPSSDFILILFLHYSPEYCSPKRMREWNWQDEGARRPGKIDFISDSPREGRKTDWRRSAVAIKAPFFRDLGDLESY